MFMKQTKVWLVLTIALSFLALASACGGGKTDTEGPATPTATGKTPPSNGGTVSGVIAYNGTAPAPKKIDTSADPVCGQKDPNLQEESNVVADGKLANVFIYIKDGALLTALRSMAMRGRATAAVTLDQNGCHRPHVLGLMTGQKLSITNSDPTQHNIHPTPKNNPNGINSAQRASPIEKTFARAEVLIPVKCANIRG